MFAVPAEPVAAAPSDFRLPPDPSATQPPPDRQGPVAPDVPESRAPAPTPTPTVTAGPAPAPTVTPPEIVLPPVAGATSAPVTARRTAAPVPTNALPAATEAAAPEPGLAQSPLPSAPAPQAAPVIASRIDSGGSAWLWLVGLVALAVTGFAGWVWWRRRQVVSPAKVPQIERPRLRPVPTPVAPPTSPTGLPGAVEPLQVTLEPLRLSLTLMNATLSYRLEIANHGLTPLTALAIGADMISAHASMSREEQLAGPHRAGGAGATLQRIERLEPGESRVVEGEFRVPFSQIVPIRQGNAALLLPLARFRVEAEGARAVVRTFLVGQPGAGAGLQPFRLDQGPRVYPKLAQRAFA